MVYEKSCGAVIYTYSNEKREYLIEHMTAGHYALCKGHVENEETEVETALREVREETGLSVHIDTNFREVLTYSPEEGHMKDVVHFVAYSDTKDTVNQIEEVSEILWLDYDKALDLLTHEGCKEILTKAEKYLNTKR